MDITEVARDPTDATACFPLSQVSAGSANSPGRTLLQRIRSFNSWVFAPWSKVPNYVWCTIFTAIGGFCFGFDTGSIGPITVMSQFQHHFFKGQEIDPTVQGLIVSSILLTASLSSLFSGPLSNKISRTRSIALGAVVFAAGSAVACSAGALPQLFVGRCIAGVGEGLFLSAIIVYTVEIAPSSSRGRLGTVIQLFVTSGIATGTYCKQLFPQLAHISCRVLCLLWDISDTFFIVLEVPVWYAGHHRNYSWCRLSVPTPLASVASSRGEA